MIKIMVTKQKIYISRLESPELEDSFVEDNKLPGDNVYD